MNAPNPGTPSAEGTVADAYLRLLADRGIDCLFANAGTDFAPLIEGYARAGEGVSTPRPVLVPHENVAVAMAMGYWLLSRRMQAVMVHVSVGTANAICGLINACRAHVPILMTAGRTPLNETGLEGHRNLLIHWTQEMYDQSAMLREFVKWDYELRNAEQMEIVVDRAIAMAQAAPAGPVYLTLPREVIATRLESPPETLPAGRRAPPAPPGPDPRAIEQAAGMLASAKNPVLITTSAGMDLAALAPLAELCERYAVPLVHHSARCMSLPTNHPMHAGFDPVPWMREADLILVVDSVVPWIPGTIRPKADAKVIHVGADPLHGGIPTRGFECDLGITSVASLALKALLEALDRRGGPGAHVEARRASIVKRREERLAKVRADLEPMRAQSPIRTQWLTHCVSEACDERTTIIREAPAFSYPHFRADHEHAYYATGAASGLGWGLGAAIGAKMAAPERTIILATGDGSYMFGVPVAAHYTAMEQDAPFLTVIMNNRRWNEVGVATRLMYPDGLAVREKREALTHFDRRLELAKVVECVGGHGEQVTDPAKLPEAIARALRIVREERRQAVLDVVCA